MSIPSTTSSVNQPTSQPRTHRQPCAFYNHEPPTTTPCSPSNNQQQSLQVIPHDPLRSLTMTEVAFAKSFLGALDARPHKLSPDHVEDPKNYPARPPYILPKMPKAMSKRVLLAPGQERSLTVTVKSLRNPPLDIKLSSQSLKTSILDIKTAVAEQAALQVDKIKVLHKKKPVADSKVLKDLVADDEASVEFSVMVMGGAAAAAAATASAAAPADVSLASAAPAEDGAGAGACAGTNPAQGVSGEAVLQTDQFWTDLRGFLLQRIRDETVTEELFGKFLSSWESQ
ncbi:cell-cycle control medial ring component-domain-containing protein [Coniella lustricola]|uniref:Cell-cycle control medial ring component-domain-containing protein n=1 Tax=Coniella lustricola TaxID=2025994 RepID=A0A2T3A592_9PEZI|nr:cell-cycle control medial ring component-domain-containing protein [Coniella lustricola]